MTDTLSAVAPIEGHYALLRNGVVEKVGEIKGSFNGHLMFHSVNFNYRWFDTGKSYWHDSQHDIIATISPEAMQAASSGENERLRAALKAAEDKQCSSCRHCDSFGLRAALEGGAV